MIPDPVCTAAVMVVLGASGPTPPSSRHHHHAPFAFLITLQMCLMAEQSLCTERGAPVGIQEACLCELSWRKKSERAEREGRG